MRIQFYCSSQYNEGYVYGEKNADGQMRRIGSTFADIYFVGGAADSVLFRSDGRLILVIKGLKPTDGMDVRTDKTRSPIHINIAFIAETAREEKAVCSLFVFFLTDEDTFSRMLFEAYDEKAGGETGYDFDLARIGSLCAYAEKAFPRGNLPPLLQSPKGLYHAVNRQEANELVSCFSIPAENAVFLIKTEMSKDDYVRRYLRKGEMLPWYVLGSGLSSGAHPHHSSFFDRFRDLMKRSLFRWLLISAVGILSVLIIALAVALNRRVPVSDYSVKSRVISYNQIEVAWEAKGATRYGVTMNGNTEFFDESRQKGYFLPNGGPFSVMVQAYGKNDKEGTLIGQFSIDLPTPSPVPEPEPTPEPLKVMLHISPTGETGMDSRGTQSGSQHTLTIQIDGVAVYESDIFIPEGDLAVDYAPEDGTAGEDSRDNKYKVSK